MLLLGLGGYFIVNTGLLSVYRVVPETSEFNSEADNAARAPLEDPNRSVKLPIFRTVSEQDNILFLRGISEPDSVVSILANGRRRRQVRANSDGIWDAEINVSADQVLGLSLISFLTEDISFNGDELLIRAVPPKAEFKSEPGLEVDGDNITSNNAAGLILLTAPGGPSRVIQTPFGRLPSRDALTLGGIEYDNLGGVIFSGFASRSGRVRIFGNNVLIGESRVSSDGRWFLIAGDTLPAKEYKLRVQLQETDGRKTNISVDIQRLAANENADQSPYVVFNDTVWHVRRNLTGGGVQYTAIFSPDGLIEDIVTTR